MTEADDPGIRVLHLDHTAEAGGAELALVRMLAAHPDWVPLVLTPPGGQGSRSAAFPSPACRRGHT